MNVVICITRHAADPYESSFNEDVCVLLPYISSVSLHIWTVEQLLYLNGSNVLAGPYLSAFFLFKDVLSIYDHASDLICQADKLPVSSSF